MRTKGVMAIFNGDRGAAKLTNAATSSQHVAFLPVFWCFSQRAREEPSANSKKRGAMVSPIQAEMAAKEIGRGDAAVVEIGIYSRNIFLLKSWLSPLV